MWKAWTALCPNNAAKGRPGGGLSTRCFEELRPVRTQLFFALGFSAPTARRPARQSMRKPTLMVTCQYATLSFSIWPRVSVTSNQCRLRSVFDAFAIAVLMASSIDLVDEPVS
jgi:hypothetical protein